MADAVILADRETLFSLLRSHGALKRAYVPLRQALPDALKQFADPHALVISAVDALLTNGAGDAQWPGSSASAYCSLLLEAVGKFDVPPSAASTAHAMALCQSHPNFFRKLAAVYGGGREAALVAARALWARGEAGEVCHLVSEFALTADDGFDVRLLLSAAIDQNKAHAAASLGATTPAYALVLLDEYIGRSKEREGMRVMPRLKLTLGDVPPPVLRRLHVGVLAPRMKWLAHSSHWDLIDTAFGNLAHAAARADAPSDTGAHASASVGAAKPPPPIEGDAAVASALDDVAAVDEAVLGTALDGYEWRQLAALLARRLVAAGLRGAAVRGCVRHRLHQTLEIADEIGEVTPEEVAAAMDASEEDVATGVFNGPLAASAPPDSMLQASRDEADTDDAPVDVHDADGPAVAPPDSGYLPLNLPDANVIVVDDAAGLDHFCACSLGGVGGSAADGRVGVLGIDVEWSDNDFIGRGDGVVQWVQLGTSTHVFLLDVPTLTTPPLAAALHAALHAVLAAPHVLKLGYGLKQDLARLRRAHPSLAPCAPDAVRPSLELGQLWLKRQQPPTAANSTRPVDGSAMPTGRRGVPGLSGLVAATFGQPLDKRMRMTNWKRRPLVRAQALYAALDAHALVLLYQVGALTRNSPALA